jgi:hypothetical protein
MTKVNEKRLRADAEKALPARHLENRLRDPSRLSEAMLLATAFELDDMLTRAHANRASWGSGWAWFFGFPMTRATFDELQRRGTIIPSQLHEHFDGNQASVIDPAEALRNLGRKHGWKG